eukprot:sb/3475227/
MENKISYLLFKLDKSRSLPTNLDPLNTMLPTEKLSKVKNMLKLMFCVNVAFLWAASVGSIVFSGSKLVGNDRERELNFVFLGDPWGTSAGDLPRCKGGRNTYVTCFFTLYHSTQFYPDLYFLYRILNN